MNLRQIFIRSKKINPLYHGTFADFILDFLNCREDFIEPQIAFSYKIERSLANYLKRYYKIVGIVPIID